MTDPKRLSRIQRAERADRKGAIPIRIFSLFVMPSVGKTADITGDKTGIHAELRLHELRAGLDLGEQRIGRPSGRGLDRQIRRADGQVRDRADVSPRRNFALVAQARRERDQVARLEIEDRLRVRLIAF